MPPDTAPSTPVLSVRAVTRRYRTGRGLRRARSVQAVDGVSFDLVRGEALGVVGESGCGKSTLARLIVALEPPDAGTVLIAGRDAAGVKRDELARMVQLVFQDPYGSLNPRMRAVDIVGEAFDIHPEPGSDRTGRVGALLALVGLQPEHLGRYPHQFSGGQRQRLGIARALALRPGLLVLDEPVSALDVSVQAQVINLLADLRRRLGLSYVLISHDLAVVGHTCDRIAVMYLGRIVEQGPASAILSRPAHPYTQALLSAAGVRNGRRVLLEADPGDAADLPVGCRFRARCPWRRDLCAEVEPELLARAGGTEAACHFAAEPT